MTEQDVPAGLRLNTLSGWNQTADDWNRFLKHSARGCFVMEHDGKVVGTATTIVYENRFAWVGMVLVDPQYRKQGIATRLLRKTMEYLDDAHVATVKLDGTPLGKPLYTKLGFVDEYEIERWVLSRSSAAVSTTASGAPEPVSEVQLKEILGLDKELFGADRSFLLRSLYERTPEFAMYVWEDRLQGYAFGRHGLFADHLGPWMAKNRAVAERVLRNFLSSSSGETLIVDSVKPNSTSGELLKSYGFAPSRPFTRMVRGPNPYPGRPKEFCAILGPEFG